MAVIDSIVSVALGVFIVFGVGIWVRGRYVSRRTATIHRELAAATNEPLGDQCGHLRKVHRNPHPDRAISFEHCTVEGCACKRDC